MRTEIHKKLKQNNTALDERTKTWWTTIYSPISLHSVHKVLCPCKCKLLLHLVPAHHFPTATFIRTAYRNPTEITALSYKSLYRHTKK